MSSLSKGAHSRAQFSVIFFLTATDTFSVEPTTPWRRKICNESRLQWEVEVCGDEFKRSMARIDPYYWCNVTHFIRQELQMSGSLLDQICILIQGTSDERQSEIPTSHEGNQASLFIELSESSRHEYHKVSTKLNTTNNPSNSQFFCFFLFCTKLIVYQTVTKHWMKNHGLNRNVFSLPPCHETTLRWNQATTLQRQHVTTFKDEISCFLWLLSCCRKQVSKRSRRARIAFLQNSYNQRLLFCNRSEYVKDLIQKQSLHLSFSV